ncbi:MAG: dihydrodipicolinate synthase family protein [Bacillota bacterium]
MKLEGIYAPIPTPFNKETIDYALLKQNLEKWEKTSLTGLVVLGSNGEFVLLDEEEKIKLTAFVRDNFPTTRPVIAGTGCESTRATIRLTEKCANLGVDAVLVITPSYYQGSMTDEALKHFFLEVADASPVPVILYNMPRNTGINMSVPLVVELSKHQNIAGIKDSSGNIVQIAGIIAGSASNFSVFAGSGNFLYPSLCLGATGGTLAVANILPDKCSRIVEFYNNGRLAEAKNLQLEILEINAAVTSRWGVAGLKAAMEMSGYYGGEVRKPLQDLSMKNKDELKEIINKLKLQNEQT